MALDPGPRAGAVANHDEGVRMTVFFELVRLQDSGTPVPESRRIIAEKFGVTQSQLDRIEEEGLLKNWAPL